MADRRDGHSRRGGDKSSYHDDRDRRRDRDRDRRRDRDDDVDIRRRDRDRSRSRDRGDRSRRYRSRSRSRDRSRDRDRHRDRDRDRHHRRSRSRSRSPRRDRDRRDDRRDRERDEKAHRRRDDERGERGGTPSRDHGDRSVREELSDRVDNNQKSGSNHEGREQRDQSQNQQLPPHHRSASPTKRMFERDGDEPTQLPTRSKPGAGTHGHGPAHVSFKVMSKDSNHGSEYQRRESTGDQHSEDSRRFDGEPMDEDEEEVVVEEEGLDEMAKMMGFSGFGSTQGKHVIGNNVYAVRKEKKTKYRQYMNRIGGFNRPLSPTR
ncbi:uncharacterized protein CTHT_0028280 [Thermochaetoides thermophila DSM 1495]|uniref:U4/U6.U5 small nuclear ribonucleoprotein 27kDa protein domain-containing protein n=1 Tax=Chaetomium thermophilum (strain DSM 1495 / CBS 144.50 / IMI 039719) TaxID=759272 RepID=G0S7I7_CHATD|nr:hypothetical protein CTHT_0028280 [Thermochaetoides thermophila DSM 1495]EGS20989.1 hypothetical protein CTHT_0028280 [Thermochaetoides thermophila DSM 1495]